jgi:hypothetical protein
MLSFLILGVVGLTLGYLPVSEETVFVGAMVFFMILKGAFEVVAHILSHTDPTLLEKLSSKKKSLVDSIDTSAQPGVVQQK